MVDKDLLPRGYYQPGINYKAGGYSSVGHNLEYLGQWRRDFKKIIPSFMFDLKLGLPLYHNGPFYLTSSSRPRVHAYTKGPYLPVEVVNITFFGDRGPKVTCSWQKSWEYASVCGQGSLLLLGTKIRQRREGEKGRGKLSFWGFHCQKGSIKIISAG